VGPPRKGKEVRESNEGRKGMRERRMEGGKDRNGEGRRGKERRKKDRK